MEMKHFPAINLEATGKNIARLRRDSGLSVRDLQDYFGFEAPQAIYKWQNGQALPTVDNLLALSRLLGVPMDSILITFGSGDAAPPGAEDDGSFFLPFRSRKQLPYSGCHSRSAMVYFSRKDCGKGIRRAG